MKIKQFLKDLGLDGKTIDELVEDKIEDVSSITAKVKENAFNDIYSTKKSEIEKQIGDETAKGVTLKALRAFNKMANMGLSNREVEALDFDTFGDKFKEFQDTFITEKAGEVNKDLATKYNDINTKFVELQNRYDEDLAAKEAEKNQTIAQFQKETLLETKLAGVNWADADNSDVYKTYIKTQLSNYVMDVDGSLKSKDNTAAPHPFSQGKTIKNIDEFINEVTTHKKMIKQNNAGGSGGAGQTFGGSGKPELSENAKKMEASFLASGIYK